MLIQGIFVSGKAWQNVADKSCNDSKALQDYKRHVEQQFQGRKNTHIDSCDSYLTTLKNHASLLKVYKILQDIHTNVRALHCDNLDHIQSPLKTVHVHYFEEACCDH